MSRIFITGITGTLGTALALFHHERGDQVWGCSRNESRAVEWLREHGRKATLFLASASSLGYDDTDCGRMLSSMDKVYHCAAMKHVDLCEEQPVAAFNENVILTHIVMMACDKLGVPSVFISSDKACLPQGVYGATKLLGEKIALKFGVSVVRLGNLIGSSGSVFHKWKECLSRGEAVLLTDSSMTRFFLPVKEAAQFIADETIPGRIVAPRMLSASMGVVAKSLAGGEVKVIGMRPGETVDQYLIAPGDRGYSTSKKYILEEDGENVFHHGVNSLHAARWVTSELLKEVGI